jgi:hypothetical protein
MCGFLIQKSQKCIKLWGIEINSNTYHGSLRTIIFQYSCQFFSASWTHHQEPLERSLKPALFKENGFSNFYGSKNTKEYTKHLDWKLVRWLAKLSFWPTLNTQRLVQNSNMLRKIRFQLQKVYLIALFVPIILMSTEENVSHTSLYFNCLASTHTKKCKPSPKTQFLVSCTDAQEWQIWHRINRSISQWLTPVILVTQELEIRRITVQSQSQANSSWNPIL